MRCEPSSIRPNLSSSDGDRRKWMRTGTPCVKPFTKGIEGQAWEALYYQDRELHQPAGTKKPGDSQKAKTLWATKAAKDRDDEFYDPAHRKDIQDRARTLSEVWKDHLKSPVAALTKTPFSSELLSSLDGGQCCLCKESAESVGRALPGMWPFLDAWDVVFLRTAAGVWNVAKKYGPYGELFFFLKRKEPVFDREAVDFGSCVSAEALKACALIGLHMIADEVTSLSLNGIFLELGNRWRYVGPRNPLWKGDVGGWTESECTSSCEVYEHNAESLALEVIGQDWSGEVASLFLEEWELARVALSCQ